jgi:hypothetical protein
MTDTTTEAIALRLREFFQAAQRKANTSEFPTQVRTRPRTSWPKESILVTYEECLNKLTDAERDELDRMIQKMSGDLGSPSGAIIPP